MKLENKSVMVTGGAGFIGSHLVEDLVDEYPEKIIVVDNMALGVEKNLTYTRERFDRLKLYKKDATDFHEMKKIFEENKIDIVFNLAIVPLPASLVKPKETTDDNIKMVTNLCELQRLELFKTLIHFSSSEAYGSAKIVPMDEKHPLNPTTPYAASKAAGDHIVLSYYDTFNSDSAIIRPFNNFGPRQNEKSYAGIIPLTIQRIVNGESPVIYGDGRQTRDYIYVTDTARMAIEIYKNERTRGQVINIGSGSEISVIELIQKIMEIMKCDKEIRYEEKRPGDVLRHLASIELAKELLGFKPQTSFSNGLKKTIQWYLNR
ncbi:MAG: SDR family NAD(P)-dependent oxidoreductase [Candidatus Thermoplasmatota archaeon]|jgi:UDP-glucose 4-epimerase|nr:SDR family NAD(P)-dependent oxidoreductase [Candidatus Thermoplasmatota archaeon]